MRPLRPRPSPLSAPKPRPARKPRSARPCGLAGGALSAALLCALLLAACAGGGSASASKEAALAEVRAFVEEFNRAYASNDLPAYWEFYAPEMTQFYPQGRLDLPDYKTYWEKHVGEGNRLTEVKIEDLVIHLGPSSDSAVAHYRIFVRTRHPDGSTAEEWAQESDVLFKRDGRWKVVHMHYSPAPEPKPASPAGQGA